MNAFRKLLLPLSILYGSVLAIRNYLYSIGFLKSHNFQLPVIVVGNLSTGGTGKTPQIEYLIRILGNTSQLATLSRGYRRQTQGFQYVQPNSLTTEVGDEPLQFKQKFPEVHVAVDANRVNGIKKLYTDHPELKIVLLDDAFQHRKVKPSLSILLTDYHQPYYNDYPLPAGNLREFRSGRSRADIIIVTKCPSTLSPIEKRTIIHHIQPQLHQRVFFTRITYAPLHPVYQNKGTSTKAPSTSTTTERQQPSDTPAINNQTVVYMLVGLANPKPMIEYVQTATPHIHLITYPDHHEYTPAEIQKLRTQFQSNQSSDKIIVTSEKDAMRLQKPEIEQLLSELPVYYLPIKTEIMFQEEKAFEKIIHSTLTQ